MPAESSRLWRRVGARDRWFVAVAAAAVAAGTPAAVLLGSGGSPPGAGGGCVSTVRASVMGGATFTYCGAQAVAFCRRAASGDAGIAAQCERLAPARVRD